jgi:hypothetical protein
MRRGHVTVLIQRFSIPLLVLLALVPSIDFAPREARSSTADFSGGQAPTSCGCRYDAPSTTPTPTTNLRIDAAHGDRPRVRRLSQSTSSVWNFLAAKGVPDFIGPVRQSSHQIGHGHAYGKHVLKKGEFPGVSSPMIWLASSSAFGRTALIDAPSRMGVRRSTTRATTRSSFATRTRRTEERCSGLTTGSTTSTA